MIFKYFYINFLVSRIVFISILAGQNPFTAHKAHLRPLYNFATHIHTHKNILATMSQENVNFFPAQFKLNIVGSHMAQNALHRMKSRGKMPITLKHMILFKKWVNAHSRGLLPTRFLGFFLWVTIHKTSFRNNGHMAWSLCLDHCFGQLQSAVSSLMSLVSSRHDAVFTHLTTYFFGLFRLL